MPHITWRHISGGILLALLLIGVFLGIEMTRSRELLYVDGMPVCEEEAAFHNGETERIVRAKVIQGWAGEQGLGDKFSYDAFLKALQTENEERIRLHQQGGQVYGPVEYTPLQYYNRMFGRFAESVL